MLVSKFAVKSVFAGAVMAPVKCVDILDCINNLISQYYIAYRKNEKYFGFCEYIPLKKQFFCISSDMSPDDVFYNLKDILSYFSYEHNQKWENVESLNLDREVIEWQTK